MPILSFKLHNVEEHKRSASGVCHGDVSEKQGGGDGKKDNRSRARPTLGAGSTPYARHT